MSADQWAAIGMWTFCAIVLAYGLVRTFVQAWREDMTRESVADREDAASTAAWDAAHGETPTFDGLREETGLGPIFEAAYQRQAERFRRQELADEEAFMRRMQEGSR